MKEIRLIALSSLFMCSIVCHKLQKERVMCLLNLSFEQLVNIILFKLLLKERISSCNSIKSSNKYFASLLLKSTVPPYAARILASLSVKLKELFLLMGVHVHRQCLMRSLFVSLEANITIELTRLGRRPGVCRPPRAASKRRDDGPNRVQRFVMRFQSAPHNNRQALLNLQWKKHLGQRIEFWAN